MSNSVSTSSNYPLHNHELAQQTARLSEEITELAAHIHAATFLLLEKIREFDELEGWCQPGLASSATAPALLYLLHGPGQPLDRFPVSPSPCSRVPVGCSGSAVPTWELLEKKSG